MSNEPEFVIKAKDVLAVQIIAEYRELCLSYNLFDQAREVQKALDEFKRWQEANPNLLHYPDHIHVPS